MATEKQTAANRLNAQKSTGPRTPEGRAAVRLNGVTHGLTAKTLVLSTDCSDKSFVFSKSAPRSRSSQWFIASRLGRVVMLKGESESDFKAIFESLEAEHQPTTPTEETLVAQLAMATWRLRRVYNMEAGFYNVGLIDLTDYECNENLDLSCRLGKVADQNTNTIALIGRQEARLERTYYRALHELQRLRKEREAKLALVSQSASVEQVPDPPSKKTNNIQSPPEPLSATKIPTPPGRAANRPPLPTPPAAAPSNL